MARAILVDRVHTGHMTRLREIIEARGVKAADLARVTRTEPSTLSKLVRGDRELRRHWADRLAPALGVSSDDLMASVGAPIPSGTAGDLTQAPDAYTPAPDLPPERRREGRTVREFDVGAAAGHGVPEQPLDGHGTHPVLAEWTIPDDYLASFTGASSNVAIIRVEGDSMEPEYGPGERVMVDLSRRKPTPPGIFVVWDGMGLVLKRVEYLPHSAPPTIRLSSVNPAYGTYEVELQENTIVARVIGRWQWR